MTRIRTVVALAGLAAACTCTPAANAAPATCTYDAATHALSVSVPASDIVDQLSILPDGSIVIAGPGSCGAATVTNTDSIDLDGHGIVQFDFNGVFEPGFTHEATGNSEIEIAVHDVQNAGFDVPGYATHAAAGQLGVNLNGDDDVDVTLDNVPHPFMGRERNPKKLLAKQGVTLTGQGGLGTGAPYTGALGLQGGKGNDTLIGGNGPTLLEGLAGDDTLTGGPANDTLLGGNGNDTLDGAAGNDTVSGDKGNDDVTGGAGQDDLGGGQGDDVIHAQDGEADHVNGGPDTDTVFVDAGLDVVTNVP